MQAVDERAEIRPLAHGVGEPDGVADERPRPRRFNLEIGMDDHGREARRGPAGARRLAGWDI